MPTSSRPVDADADDAGRRSVPAVVRLRRVRTRLRRAVLRRRRLLAAVLVALAVATAVRATAAPPPPTVSVLVAAHDLAGGEVLDDDDLVEARFAVGTAPDDLATDAVGRVLAAPLRRGEPVTAVRLVGPGLVSVAGTTTDDEVALPVRLPDAGAVGLLRTGDRVDLVATDAETGEATTVAADVAVLAVPPDDSAAASSGLPGRLVVVGVPEADVADVASATTRDFVSYSWTSDENRH